MIPQPNRLISLDALRGFTIAAMLMVNFPGSEEHVFFTLRHTKWNGLSFTDLVAPIFLFVVGASISFAYQKRKADGSPKGELYKKIVIRSLKIFAVGMFLNLIPDFNFDEIRWTGTLHRIAFVFLGCAILFLNTDWKQQAWICAAILVGYWLALTLIPTPGVGKVMLEPGVNIVAWVDSQWLHNCQNSAIALVKEGRDKEALVYLQGVSKLMRAVLEHSVKDRITLEAEIDFLRQYLALEALRLKGLHFSVEADEELLKDEVLLPALLVQPFVENAIWHGLAAKEGDRIVGVRFRSTEGGLRCTVTDNGIGRQDAAGRANGEHSYATELTQERLLLLTHRMQQKGTISIVDRFDEQKVPSGTEVVIELVI